MTIKLKPETEARFIASIKRYFDENLDDDIGDLKASLMLEIRAAGDRTHRLQSGRDRRASASSRRRDRLDSSCYEADLGYWHRK
jgi:hypothetical protein